MTLKHHGPALLIAALLLAPWATACRQPAPEVRVGSKKFTESVVLGEIVTQLLRGSRASAARRP